MDCDSRRGLFERGIMVIGAIGDEDWGGDMVRDISKISRLPCQMSVQLTVDLRGCYTLQ